MHRSTKYLILALLCTYQMSAQDLSDKANAFLDLLSEDLRREAHYPLDDAERFNMNYIPIPRKGPRFHDFDGPQKEAALALLSSSLSPEGYKKTREIMELEKVLRIIENNDNDKMPDGLPRRDPLNYHFCIFGEPSPTTPWGWRFEGHHVSLSFTSIGGTLVSGTPAFMGTNPGMIKTGEQKGKQVLQKESELGFALVNALTKEQLKVAKFADVAPKEIITATDRKVNGVEKKGIPYPDLDEGQKKLFMELLETYIGNYIFEFSETFRAKIKKAGIENLSFAWAGSMKPGVANYYRIHGPMLLIEFDNTQNNANHMHTVTRDLTNDYAEDLLQKHYADKH